MSATYYPGEATYRCYNDYVQAGCPGHTIRAFEKHGGLYVQFKASDESWKPPELLPYDFHFYYALGRLVP